VLQCKIPLLYFRKQKEGVSVKSDGQLRARLVKLTENPQLSETLDYVIHEGRQVIGRWTVDPDATSDIMLHGPLIAECHWLVAIKMIIRVTDAIDVMQRLHTTLTFTVKSFISVFIGH